MIDIAKLTYTAVLGAGALFGSHPSIAGAVSSFSAVPGSAIALNQIPPPAIPVCEGCDKGTTWGPVVVSDFLASGCSQNADGRNYLEQNMYKTKYVCKTGNYWKCERTVKADAGCATYSQENCPTDTCLRMD